MLGPNLAHVWKSDASHFNGNDKTLADAMYIVFTQNSFGKKFFTLPEMANIHRLIIRAEKGLKFGIATRNNVASLFHEAHLARGIDQFFLFVKILNLLANAEDDTALCSSSWKNNLDDTDLHRIDSVLDFLLLNFRNDVKLEDVASVANMSVNAFCRYFKDRTNKTVIQFLNEIRIEHAHRHAGEIERR